MLDITDELETAVLDVAELLITAVELLTIVAVLDASALDAVGLLEAAALLTVTGGWLEPWGSGLLDPPPPPQATRLQQAAIAITDLILNVCAMKFSLG